ncbi:MAG: secondary thiamine-phosphate synthase enzyme YjbQ [Flavobacteriales bacterium]
MLTLYTDSIQFETQGHTDIINITDRVQDLISASGLTEGQALIFAVGSTGGISTVEYEPGLVEQDIAEMFDHFSPYGKGYAHNRTWGDDNGAAHLRSTLTGTSLNVPFQEGRLILGTWQQIVFLDFDTRGRSRQVVVQAMGK